MLCVRHDRQNGQMQVAVVLHTDCRLVGDTVTCLASAAVPQSDVDLPLSHKHQLQISEQHSWATALPDSLTSPV